MSEVNATHTKNTEKACWAEERRLLPTSQKKKKCTLSDVSLERLVTKILIVHFTFSYLIALFV